MNKKGIAPVVFFIIAVVFVLAIMAINVGKHRLSVFGSDEITFTYSHAHDAVPLFIGDKEFRSSPLSYICGDIGKEVVRYPHPRADCWKSEVSYDGKRYTFYGGQEKVQITEYLSVEFTPWGKVYYDDELMGEYKNDNDWYSSYSFTLNPSGILDSEIAGVNDKAILNSETEFVITINNDLASFDQEHAGYWYRTKHDLLERGESWQTMRMPINEGKYNYLLPPDTSELGRVTLEFQPFIMIEADQNVTIKQNKPLMLKYEVVMDLPESNPDMPQPERGRIQKIWDSIKDFFRGIFGWLS